MDLERENECILLIVSGTLIYSLPFVDDDEIADPNWLLTMYQIITSEKVDAVQGPVIDLLPENAPRWAVLEAQ